MIVTQQRRIPWSWVIMMTMPCMLLQMLEAVSSNALTFTIRRFTDDALKITCIGGIAMLFNFLVSPYIAWKSDRIWTRLGRRRPFLIMGLIGAAVGLFFIPFAPSLLTLIIPVVIFGFFFEIAFYGTFDPLMNEVVPVPQRGRNGAIKAVFHNFGTLYFGIFLIGNFDYYFAGTKFKGEQIIYWLMAVLCLIMALHFALNFRETYVAPPPTKQRFTPWGFARDLFGEHQWRMVYLLVFIQISLQAGLANLGGLLITEQFGLSKQQMGMISIPMNISKIFIFLPLAGFLADRVDRMKLLLFGVVGSTLYPIVYWIFIHTIAGGHPTYWQIVGFEIYNGCVDVMANISLAALFFDFIPRNKMGTVFAGMTFARGSMRLISSLGVGVWVKYYSRFFGQPGVNDYSSGLLFLFLFGVVGVASTLYVYHERKSGRIIEYGKLECTQESQTPSAEVAEAGVS